MLIGWARLHQIGFPLQTDFEKEFQKRIASEFDLNASVNWNHGPPELRDIAGNLTFTHC